VEFNPASKKTFALKNRNGHPSVGGNRLVQFRSKNLVQKDPHKIELPAFWISLERLMGLLHISFSELAGLMELSPRELRLLKVRNQSPSMSSMVKLCKRLNITLQSLLNRTYDPATLVAQYTKKINLLPEKYLLHAYSKCRTLTPLFKLIESELGWEQRQFIFRKFQLTEEMFLNPEAPVNMGLAVDISEYLLGYYRRPSLLLKVGHLGAQSLSATPLFLEMVAQKNTSSFFEMAGSSLATHYLEKNYHWRVERKNTGSILFTGKPTEWMKETPGYQNFLKPAPCLIRTGYLDRLPQEGGFGRVGMKKVSCVSQGDSACRWEIETRTQTTH
jgi:transcriptional regulator with XRE-family HTH domain